VRVRAASMRPARASPQKRHRPRVAFTYPSHHCAAHSILCCALRAGASALAVAARPTGAPRAFLGRFPAHATTLLPRPAPAPAARPRPLHAALPL
jgi:hypothetical protein